MRGEDRRQPAMWSYLRLEERVPKDHPLRALRRMTDQALSELDPLFDRIYFAIGRPSIPPERLLRALVLQLLYSIRSERLLMERLDSDLYFRWFVGLELDEAVWDPSTFSQNRERFIDGEVASRFFAAVVAQARRARLLSDSTSASTAPSSKPGPRRRASNPRREKAAGAAPPRAAARATSKERAGATTPTPAAPTLTRASIARAMARRPGSATSATCSSRTEAAWPSADKSRSPAAAPSARRPCSCSARPERVRAGGAGASPWPATRRTTPRTSCSSCEGKVSLTRDTDSG